MRGEKKGSIVSVFMFFVLGLILMPHAAFGDTSLSLLNLFNGQTVQNNDHLQVNGMAFGLGNYSSLDVVFVVDDTSVLNTVDPANYRNNAFHDLFQSFTSDHDVRVGIISLKDQQNTSLLAGLQQASASTGTFENIFLTLMNRQGTSLAIGQGIKLAVQELQKNGRANARKLILVFATGNSTDGPDPEQEARNAAANGYTVSFVYLASSSTTAAPSFLQLLANAGNGTASVVNNPHDIFSIFNNSSITNISNIQITNITNNQSSTIINSQLGAFTGTVPLTEGNNTIQVTVNGTDGTIKTQTVQITKQGADPCTTNPLSCLSSRPLKLKPQVLMAGFDPMVLDYTTTRFKVVALIREGSVAVRSVSLTENSGSLKYAMNKIGSLSNGDLLYGIDIPIDRGESFSYKGAFGSETGQFNILITDTASQTQRFPNVEYGNNANLSGSTANPTTAAIYTQKGCKRLVPQVIMAGFDSPVLDYNDTGIKVRAIVRDGSRPVSNVKLSQSSGSLSTNMTKVETLPNGDHLYEGTLTFERGSFPSGSFRNLWGEGTSQLMVEARDDAAQKHQFPDLKRGDYASMNSADCWADQ